MCVGNTVHTLFLKMEGEQSRVRLREYVDEDGAEVADMELEDDEPKEPDMNEFMAVLEQYSIDHRIQLCTVTLAWLKNLKKLENK